MIVAGFGFRTSVTRSSLADAYAKARGRAHGSASVFATAADKATTPAFQRLASDERATVTPVAAGDLIAQPTITQSEPAKTARGTGSVAEAAALAAAGPQARLLAPRAVSDDGKATCALAEGSKP
ncbi:MAG: cobalamin biosynthesis protein [Pseudomonadota bacterium]